MAPLRILFMGTPDFAAASLQALIDSPDELVAVVTQPDRARGRGKRLSPPPVKVLAEAHGIPVLQPTKIKTAEFHRQLEKYSPDLGVVAAYGRILPKSLLLLPKMGCINVHGSLLPQYRGAAPVQWAVIRGEELVGVTIIQMDEGMDTGDMLGKASLMPAPGETGGSLMAKLAALGGRTLVETIAGLKNGTIVPQPQDHSQATLAPMLSKGDGLIDWNRPATEISRLIRGLDPWPSAYCFHRGQRLRLFSPTVVHADCDLPPGTVIEADRRGLTVCCGRSRLRIGAIQSEGRKRLTVDAFLRGYPIAPGASLADPPPEPRGVT